MRDSWVESLMTFYSVMGYGLVSVIESLHFQMLVYVKASQDHWVNLYSCLTHRNGMS